MCVLVSQSCPALWDPINCSLPGSSVREISQAKNTGVCLQFLLQGTFPTQGWNPVLLHCRQILSHLSHQGKEVSWQESIENWDATICYVLLVLTEKYMLRCTQEPPIFTCTTQIDHSPSECAVMVIFKIIAPNSSIRGSLETLKLATYYSRVEDS